MISILGIRHDHRKSVNSLTPKTKFLSWHRLMTDTTLIELNCVSKSFDGGRSFAVNDLSLAIERGSFVTLVGPSGSGKTTTCKFINRLVDPDCGEVCIDRRTIASIPPAELRRGIGYVFQGVGLFPHMRVGENIGISPQLLGWPRAEIEARTAELLDLMGLPQAYASRFPDELSGGERQRVGVARALVMGRRDTPAREVMLRELTRWMRERYGVTVLGSLGFENGYVLAMKRERAASLGIVSIADLAPHAPQCGH